MDETDRLLTEIIASYCGLQIHGAHLNYVRSYARGRMAELHMEPAAYCRYITDTPAELALLVDEAAINETYFFREDRQFVFLRDLVFPGYAGTRAVIWSACCATGEEPVSLAVLARSCGVDADVYASDIDKTALAVLEKGTYTQASFRPDGKEFHALLEQYGQRGGDVYTVGSAVMSSVHPSVYNLAGTDPCPLPEESVDLIFMRNVFIYFNKETQDRVISRLSGCIKPGGLLFFSMNEIAGIDAGRLGLPLKKEHCGSVYFFRKAAADSPPVFRDPPVSGLRERERERPSGSAAQRQPPGSVPPVRKAASARVPVSVCADAPVTVRRLGEQILSAIDRRDLKQARSLLESCSCVPSELEYRYYYSALILKEEGSYDEAAALFFKASLLVPEFWPASLQLGLLYEERGKRKNAEKAFSGCAKVLEKYIEQQKTCYNFLVASFSPSYFYTLCTVYIEKGKKHGV